MSIAIGVLALSLIGADLPQPKTPPGKADAEPLALWQLTLPDAIKICLDNSEIVRMVSFSGMSIPVFNCFGPPMQCGDVPAPAAEPDALWQLTLPEAIKTCLDNDKISRFIVLGGAGVGSMMGGEPASFFADANHLVIAQVDRSASPWRFQAEVMAAVRSTEQLYWELAQQHVQLWASEKAMEQARELLKREQAELQVGRGTVADVAEVEQRLEQLTLDFVTQTSDVVTAERRLRKVLGLPPADNRRIIPVTPPTEKPVKPDWAECVATLEHRQPDVAEQRAAVERLERTLTAVSLTLQEQTPTVLIALGLDSSRALHAVEEALLAGPRASLKQAEHKTVHSLARFFLEVDAHYKQFQTASRWRATAAQRLEAQRTFYEEGRIPIDRYLDAMSRYTAAVAQQAQFKTTYNISIVALEEAKGTLLDARGIKIALPPRRVKPYPKATDPGLQKASFTPDSGQSAVPSGR